MKRAYPPIPTLGYPNQAAAIVALYERRVEPKRIAELTGAAINSVHRAIRKHRLKTGRVIEPVRNLPKSEVLAPDTWQDDEDIRRADFHRRAVLGARSTLEAMAR